MTSGCPFCKLFEEIKKLPIQWRYVIIEDLVFSMASRIKRFEEIVRSLES